jgi:hypothetical protein
VIIRFGDGRQKFFGRVWFVQKGVGFEFSDLRLLLVGESARSDDFEVGMYFSKRADRRFAVHVVDNQN